MEYQKTFRASLFLLAVLVIALAAGGCGKPPPIVLITLDTTRRDVVTPYNERAGVTPALMEFSKQATVYTRAFATSPWTLPSHASIFTGLYPSHHGAGVRSTRLGPEAITLAELLRRKGYFTAGVAGGPLCRSNLGVAQGFFSYRNPDKRETTADRVTAHVRDILRNQHRDHLFIFANYFDPHFPYDAPAAFRKSFGVDALFADLSALPEWQTGVSSASNRLPDMARASGKVPDVILRYLEGAYRAEVAFMDHEIGAMFDDLKEEGLYDEALIVVVADHGEFLGERGLFFHSYRLDPELTHIPLLIKRPRQKARAVEDTPVTLVDLFPIILTTAGVAVPPCDGVLRREKEALPVLMEEHTQKDIHSLVSLPMKIADDVYGAADSDALSEVWDRGIGCFRRSGEQWDPASCEDDWKTKLDSLRASLENPSPGRSNTDGGTLSEEEKDQLRSLGYVK
jgi:arylsulfatase A-like enzyme